MSEKPKLLILGHARHGKDTVAEILRDKHGFDFRSSSHFLAETVVMPALAFRGFSYRDVSECYDDRVNHRALWREIIANHNQSDPTRLSRAILDVSDCYVGMRTVREYHASIDLFDSVAWVDASGRDIPPEGRESMTIEFDPKRMHLIDNGGTTRELEIEVHNFVEKIGAGQQIPLPLA